MNRYVNLTTDEARAVLDGRKWQLRRPVKFRRSAYMPPEDLCKLVNPRVENGAVIFEFPNRRGRTMPIKPPWQVGDMLYMRESWATDYLHDDKKPSGLTRWDSDIFYKADGDIDTKTDIWVHRWRASTHMPAWAVRIKRKVLRVWVEQVRKITWDDAIAEGSEFELQHYGGDDDPWPIGGFINTWDARYAKGGFAWERNPWVWIVEFEKEQ